MYTEKIKLFLLASLIILLINHWGCSDKNPTEPETIEAPFSRLNDIQNKVFNQNCAVPGCHGNTGSQTNLSLTEGNSYSNLVNVQSVIFPQFKRVVPDSSSNSLLIKILRGEVLPRMPFNRDPLPATVIDSIAAWIDNGALNN
jgi:hypothetical protein